MTSVAFLGPEGTFTHQAALEWLGRSAGSSSANSPVTPIETSVLVHDAVAARWVERGVVPLENSVEGYVMPVLDALLDSQCVVAVDQVVLPIAFDAFARPGHGVLTELTAHPHGLAQCSQFGRQRGLKPVPATSNGAACRDVGDNQIALGPRLCGTLYRLDTVATDVQDFTGAVTRFLVLARREVARKVLEQARESAAQEQVVPWHTMLAITPTATGPGVLARVTAAFGQRGINMTSLIERPLKAQINQYAFVATFDAAPWDSAARALFTQLLAAGDSLKTLGVFAAPTFPTAGRDPGNVLPADVPPGSVGPDAGEPALNLGLLW